MKILHLDSSITDDQPVGRQLTARIVESLVADTFGLAKAVAA